MRILLEKYKTVLHINHFGLDNKNELPDKKQGQTSKIPEQQYRPKFNKNEIYLKSPIFNGPNKPIPFNFFTRPPL